LERLSFNTAIAALMELVNTLNKLKQELPMPADEKMWRTSLESLLQMLAPFAPHISEELWQELGHDKSIHISAWPAWDEDSIKSELITIVVQVNGKVRANLQLPPGTSELEVKEIALAEDNVARHLGGKTPTKTIYIKNRLLSIVI
jgi:leucyl-tRNA synthetase